MPNDEYQPILYRDLAVANAQPVIEVASPLLREVVNHATWAFQRCQAAPTIEVGEENEDAAAFVLYRHLIELVDGIQVLHSASCSYASVPILRAAFEAFISLRYILLDDYKRRSLSWIHGHISARIRLHERYDRNTTAGADAARAFERDLFPEGLPAVLLEHDSRETVARIRSVLERPQFTSIESEYRRLMVERRRRGRPEWYELFNGPRNRRELARSVGEEAQYLNCYGEWSGFSHATDASAYLTSGDQPRTTAFFVVRTPTDLAFRAFLATQYLFSSTRLMINHFRPGENLQTWYLEDVKPRWFQLKAMNEAMSR